MEQWDCSVLSDLKLKIVRGIGPQGRELFISLRLELAHCDGALKIWCLSASANHTPTST